MNAKQLDAVNDVLNITNATVVNDNKLFQEKQRLGVEENSKQAIREGQRCLLRAEIVRIYYRYKDE